MSHSFVIENITELVKSKQDLQITLQLGDQCYHLNVDSGTIAVRTALS